MAAAPAQQQEARQQTALFLKDGGEMGARMRALDWSASPLGEPDTWPEALRTLVGVMLSSKFPMFVLWGPQYACLYNDGYIPILGARHPGALGRPYSQIWPEIWTDILPLIERAYAGESTFFESLPLQVERNGFSEQAHFTFSYSPVRASSHADAVDGMFCACFETSEQVQSKVALQASEARWRGLFESMQEGLFVGEAMRDGAGHMHDFRIVEINPAFESQTGLVHSAVVGRSMREVVPAIPDTLIVQYAGVVDSGRPAQFETHVPTPVDRWFEARARALGNDRFAVLFLDITQRKQAEAVLQQSEARFRNFAQAMPHHVWTSDASGRLDWFNDRVYEYAGVAQGTLDGDNWGRIVHPDDLPNAANVWARAVQAGVPYHTEFRVRHAEAGFRWHLVRAVPMYGQDGAIESWIGTNTDIEDRRAAADALAQLNTTLEEGVRLRTAELEEAHEALRQSQKLEAIGKLTGGVAHDFNNVLQVIGGNLQLLRHSTQDDHHAHRRLNAAMAGVDRGAKLASQLLAFARKQPLEPVVMNVGRLVRDIDDMLRRALGESIELETVISGGLWNTLADPNRLENVLLNLAINARDAMQGQGRLTIETGNASLDDAYARAHLEVVPGQYVMVAVSDTGSGMSAEVMARAFEPFFTTKPEGHGTGLGLSMVYGFVKQSGGHVKIYSEPGHGTTIRLYLPRSHAAVDAPVVRVDGPVVGGTETVLVVEDDAQVRETVVEMLSDLGYRVFRSPDAQSALAVIESGVPIDLLFTDVVMPGTLRSPELARRAKAVHPKLEVLFTSGYTENAIVHHGRLDPGVALLSKPYHREDLARKIRHLFRNRDHAQGLATQAAAGAGKGALPASAGATSVRPLRLLVVEDNTEALESTLELLGYVGHEAVGASTGEAALARLEQEHQQDGGNPGFDVLMTDISLPGLSGHALAARARQLLPALQVVYASGYAASPEDVAEALWLQKPFDLARMEAVLAAVQRPPGAGA